MDIICWFDYGHLPEGSMHRETSEKFHALAHELLSIVPQGPELNVALRKLLESKDAAVRASLVR